VISGFLLLATVVALALSISGVAPRAWLLLGAVWAIYGLLHGVLDFLLEPLADFLARTLSSVGLERVGVGFSEVETLVAQGHVQAAADAYLVRAEVPADRLPALVRRAALLAGPLQNPAGAVRELEALRAASRDLPPGDDILVGLALVDLYDHRLADPGRAMGELRRLIDRHPRSHHVRRMRAMLVALRERHFGDPVTPETGA